MNDTDTSATAEYRLDDQVGYLLRLANQRHAAIFQGLCIANLTPTQFAALVRLAELKKCSQNELGRHASMDIATIKGVVDRLREKGLVTTEHSAEDKRRMLVKLSKQGEVLIDDLMEVGTEISRSTLEPLSRGERRTFLKLLRKLT